MNRKTTPDILGALMGKTKPESQLAVRQESNKDVQQENKKPIKSESNKAINIASNKQVKQSHFEGMEPVGVETAPEVILKEKATFNLSKAILSELEDCWIEIRRLRKDKKISKTDIVEQAIEESIKDFKLKRELSKFYGKLESNKAGKQ